MDKTDEGNSRNSEIPRQQRGCAQASKIPGDARLTTRRDAVKKTTTNAQ